MAWIQSDLHREDLALESVVVSELVSGLAVGNLVVPEPFEDFLQLPRKLPEKGRRQQLSDLYNALINYA